MAIPADALRVISVTELNMAKGTTPPNAPSKTGNPSGTGRGNNPPKAK